jgi:hypothetical protein
MKTLQQIHLEIRKHKTCSRMQLYRYIRAFGIRHLGARQRPQRYPDDAAERILSHLGFDGGERIVSLAELRAERAKARKARRAA